MSPPEHSYSYEMGTNARFPPRPGALQTQADFSGQASHQTSGPRHDCFDDLPVSQRCDLKDAQGSNHNPNVDNLKVVRGLFHGRSCLPHPHPRATPVAVMPAILIDLRQADERAKRPAAMSGGNRGARAATNP
jgi:hypothetical protein